MNFHNVTDRVKLLFTDGTWRKGDRPQNKNLPCRGIADKNNFLYKHSCTNRRTRMRVMLYMGFTTSANIFNQHNKDSNTFWYPNQHSKDCKTLTIRPHLRQFPSESRFTDLSDISWKLTKLGRCLLGFFSKKTNWWEMNTRIYETSQELSPESFLDCSLVHTMKTLNQTSVSNIEIFSNANSLISL